MIRTLLALDGGLVRGALAYVLAHQSDIDVVGEVDNADDVEPTIVATRPDITVIDLSLTTVEDLPRAGAAPDRFGGCRVLVLVAPRRARLLSAAMSKRSSQVGFLGMNVAPQRVVDSVRRLARGEIVIDGELIVAALAQRSPLTPREVEVLDVAAGGCPVNEIAQRLALSPGTVRNHLSRVMGKAGARSRIDAVRIARDSGWI